MSEAPASAGGTAPHLPGFDGLRALAAIAVVFHHAAIGSGYAVAGPTVPFTNGQNFGSYFAHLDSGVQIFFLISGFLLYRPFVASAFAQRPPGRTREFFWRRALRIYPAYWVAFIGIALFVRLEMPVPGVRSMSEYFFLVQLYDVQKVHGVFRALGGISQSWTLVVEISFYVFVPLYAALLRRVGGQRDDRSRLRVEIAGLVSLYVISLAWRAFAYGVMPAGSAFRFLGVYWLPANLDLFSMGMGLALASVWISRHGPGRIANAIGRFDWPWWIAAFVCLHAATFWIGLHDTLDLVHGTRAFTRQLLYGLTALCLLMPAVFGDQSRGPVRRFLQLRPVVYLGTISYGIYLWHQAFLKKLMQWLGWDGPAHSFYLARLPHETTGDSFHVLARFVPFVAAALAMSFVVASASWFLVERPVLRFKHWRLRARNGVAAGSRAN